MAVTSSPETAGGGGEGDFGGVDEEESLGGSCIILAKKLNQVIKGLLVTLGMEREMVK